MKDSSRVDMPCGSFVYAAGWCAHGPRGVIVDTQQEAVVVADRIAKDIMARKDVTGELVSYLRTFFTSLSLNWLVRSSHMRREVSRTL